MKEDDIGQVPKEKSLGDLAYVSAKVIFSKIPLVGAPAAELLSLIVTPPLEKRRTEWLENVGAKLKELEDKKSISLDDLRDNEAFIDMVLQATQVALRTSQREKRDALKNAVMNAAQSDSPEVTLQQIFIHYVDTFTVWHIKLLELFGDPPSWFMRNDRKFPNMQMGGLSHILEYAYPDLKGKRELYDQIWKDLYTRGLVSTDSLHITISESGLKAKRLTEMGQQFMSFISESEPDSYV